MNYETREPKNNYPENQHPPCSYSLQGHQLTKFFTHVCDGKNPLKNQRGQLGAEYTRGRVQKQRPGREGEVLRVAAEEEKHACGEGGIREGEAG